MCGHCFAQTLTTSSFDSGRGWVIPASFIVRPCILVELQESEETLAWSGERRGVQVYSLNDFMRPSIPLSDNLLRFKRIAPIPRRVADPSVQAGRQVVSSALDGSVVYGRVVALNPGKKARLDVVVELLRGVEGRPRCGKVLTVAGRVVQDIWPARQILEVFESKIHSRVISW